MARLEAVGLDVGGSGGGESACLMEAGLRETERQRQRDRDTGGSKQVFIAQISKQGWLVKMDVRFSLIPPR